MPDTISIPQVGAVPKRTALLVGAAGAGVVVYLVYRQRQTAAADAAAVAAAPPEDPYTGMTDTGSLDGSVSGYATDQSSDTGTTGPTTNAAWSQAAAESLAGSYDTQAITDALGRYLSRQPLSDLDQRIVQAAIAFMGYPPEGSYSLIPGGNSGMTVAPAGLRVTGTTATTATLSWSPVAGAGYYRVYRSGVADNIGATDASNHSITVGGLQPNTAYTFYVAADTTSGVPGPRSAGATGRTTATALKAPSRPTVSAITKSTAAVRTGAVHGAGYYRWYVNGTPHGASDSTTYTLTGLRAGSRYSVTVAADTTSQQPGPQSPAAEFTTKK